MALIKEIILDSGIITNYHRVASVNNITNHASIIEVASYASKAKREEEKSALQNNESMNVFINSDYISLPYNKTLDVDGAYEHLKTLPQFAGFTDDL